MADLATLQKDLSYRFKKMEILTRALTHRSFGKKQDDLDDYERLEFLGDRVLGLIVAEMLLRDYQSENVGAIAKRHSALVRGKTLVKIANQLNLALYVKRDHNDQNVRDSILEDVCEALIAALYRDGGMDVARAFVEKFWQPFLHADLDPPQDSKSRLQEWAQAKGLDLPFYKIEKQVGPDHSPSFNVSVELKGYDIVYGQGRSKKEAEKIAAEKLYKVVIDHD